MESRFTLPTEWAEMSDNIIGRVQSEAFRQQSGKIRARLQDSSVYLSRGDRRFCENCVSVLRLFQHSNPDVPELIPDTTLNDLLALLSKSTAEIPHIMLKDRKVLVDVLVCVEKVVEKRQPAPDSPKTVPVGYATEMGKLEMRLRQLQFHTKSVLRQSEEYREFLDEFIDGSTRNLNEKWIDNLKAAGARMMTVDLEMKPPVVKVVGLVDNGLFRENLRAKVGGRDLDRVSKFILYDQAQSFEVVDEGGCVHSGCNFNWDLVSHFHNWTIADNAGTMMSQFADKFRLFQKENPDHEDASKRAFISEGSIGSFVHIEFTKNNIPARATAILTGCHCAFTVPDVLEGAFNDLMAFARKDNHMDFAILEIDNTLHSNCIGCYNRPDMIIDVTDNNTPAYLTRADFAAVNFDKSTPVMKMGQRTGVTLGTFYDFVNVVFNDKQSCTGHVAIQSMIGSQLFAAPGDSGSIYYALIDMRGWVPFAIHRSGFMVDDRAFSIGFLIEDVVKQLKSKFGDNFNMQFCALSPDLTAKWKCRQDLHGFSRIQKSDLPKSVKPEDGGNFVRAGP